MHLWVHGNIPAYISKLTAVDKVKYLMEIYILQYHIYYVLANAKYR